MGSLGVGLRAALSGGAPGGWASDHREETAHNTGFNYIAVHAIASQVAGATVSVFADGDLQSSRQSQRKSLARRFGSFQRWKSLYGADNRESDPFTTNHPLVRLLKRPNPYESGASFRYRQAQQMRLTGTCLIWNVPSLSGPTCERYVIPTAMASPVAPTTDLPRGGWRINPVASRYTPIVDDGYVDCPSWYRILGQIVDARQVQVIRFPHAWYLDDGQSPLSAGAKWIDAGEAVDEARYHQLKNGIDPSIVWNLPPDVSPDQNEIDRTQAKISAKYGGPENVGRVLVAQNGTTITPLTTSPKEMCYSEGFQDLKSAILAIHQTPPVAVGLQEPGAYAAYNASMKAWRHSAIQPLCDILAESDTEHLAPQFGTGLTVEIESDTVDDMDLIERQLENDLAAKVRTKNEWRAVRGMPPLPGLRGEAWVGTDESSREDNSQWPVAEAPSSEDVANPHPQINTVSRPLFNSRPKADQPAFGTSSRNPDRDKQWSSAADRHEQPRDPGDRLPSGSAGHASDDESILERARLLAEVLFGLYGPSVLSRLQQSRQSTAKSFDPALHPRDELGRFESVDISAARDFISRVLEEKGYSAADPNLVMQHLSVLPTAELVKLHEKHGVVPAPELREHLERSVLARLFWYLRSTDRTFPNRSRSQKVTVYIQQPEDVRARITSRSASGDPQPLTPKQWGQLVGAQPGASVHVHPMGTSQVMVVVDHPDYLARRIVGSDSIFNDFMIVSPRSQKQGIAFRAFSQQAKTARELGFKSIVAGAAGNGTKISVHEEDWEWQGLDNPCGYYTWARFGFTGEIDSLMKDRVRSHSAELKAIAADFKKKFPGIHDVSELMRTKRGRDWWLKYGGYFEGRFDLEEKSLSQEILAKYTKEKLRRKKSQSKSLAPLPADQSLVVPDVVSEDASVLSSRFEDFRERRQSSSSDENLHVYEYADPLTPEDEKILDRIWDEIAAES